MAGSRVGALHWDQEQILVLADGQTVPGTDYAWVANPRGTQENTREPLRTP